MSMHLDWSIDTDTQVCPSTTPRIIRAFRALGGLQVCVATEHCQALVPRDA